MSWRDDYPEHLLSILAKRGYKTKRAVESFINPDYEDLHDPGLLPDMAPAVARIKRAVAKQETIAVYGDYDIDGLSATALLVTALGQMGAPAVAHIPDRFEEGYGVSAKALKKLQAAGASLVITVDCGSSSHEPLKWAKEHKLDVIVTDHHLVPAQLPPAVAIINPKRSDSQYPFADLAGVGVAFKLIQALRTAGVGGERFGEAQEKWLLDLVALGTVCDVVELTGENRTLVYWGLEILRRTPRAGLRALAATAGLTLSQADTYHIGFIIGPRLNAAGRLTHARRSLDLLLCAEPKAALTGAKQLEAANYERRRQQEVIMAAATRAAEAESDSPVLVLADAAWSHGIIGIVAAKLMERFGKPVLLLQIQGKEAKGSGRSLGDFNLVKALTSCQGLLIKYGGHHFAAGCSLKTADIPQLKAKLNEYYQKGGFGDLSATQEPTADYAPKGLEVLDWQFFNDLERLAPFGRGNPRPILKLEAELASARAVGREQNHLQFSLKSGQSYLRGIGFNLAAAAVQAGQRVEILCELDKNIFNGRASLQLKARRLQAL